MLIDETGEALQEGLFQLGGSAFADFVTTDPVTLSDAWTPYDLKDRAQPAVYAANAPRPASALHDLAVVLDPETDARDPTCFGRPTVDGVDNCFDDDGSAADVWGSSEIPCRSRVFRHAPAFGGEEYKRSAAGEVQYARAAPGAAGGPEPAEVQAVACPTERHDLTPSYHLFDVFFLAAAGMTSFRL
ncbi:hypothetical protein [Streptomyces sp. BE133]|uniref:hypothetical protein n=1 Tax=Streptomyces sp. BE133 TaxID=3002523 RepID=UPI002E766D33|nr:hypothetical protein [Streptomyces sp. BE133]MEE1807901.1 hypothetical protein [Streptomyces sp. BE133]